MKKTYILTIQYDSSREEIEYISEALDIDDGADEVVMKYGEIYLDDYFDQEGLDLISDSYIMGIS